MGGERIIFSPLTSHLSHLNGDVAQLGERLLCKQEVSGSRPLISTMQEAGSKKTEARNAVKDFKLFLPLVSINLAS